MRFHNCGLGDYFSEESARAIQSTRLASLCNAMSGVSHELLENITQHLNKKISPRMPQEGSVGASGDLTPLSYLAAALMGEQTVYCNGKVMEADAALAENGISPYKLKPKEGLAIMNGTAVMTGVACMAYKSCLLYTSPSPRDATLSRMPSSA